MNRDGKPVHTDGSPAGARRAKGDGQLPRSRTAGTPARSDPGRAGSQPQSVVAELDVLIRARYSVIYVVTSEEERVEQALWRIARRRGKQLYIWTCTQGLRRHGSDPSGRPGNTADPIVALDAVINSTENAIFLFKDFHWYTEEIRCNLSVIRKLRDAAYELRDSYKTIVLVAPRLRLATDLDKDVTVVEFPLPGTDELNTLLDRLIEELKENPAVRIDLSPQEREKLVQSARGLTLREAENVFAKALVVDGGLSGEDIETIYSEKRQIIRKSGVLDYYETNERLDDVGGLDALKDWLRKRGLAFTTRAKAFGLPHPRGVLLLGVQGCGKSLCAKAVANLWRMPLLRMDVGRLFGSMLGSSEENMRRAIQTAESVAPCILWVDEIDKALAGAAAGAGDSGTAARVLATFLTWLAEKTAPVFVVATANSLESLPPELLRKGRLDEIFFVDLPTTRERKEIFRIHIARRGRDPSRFDLDLLAAQSEGFSGAEIEEAVVSALFDAFYRGEELSTELIAQAIAQTVPLSKTMSDQLTQLRSWAQGRARLATTPEQQQFQQVRHRKLEL